MKSAKEIAKWFINNGYTPSDSKDGNMKLNKLLYFAQLISLIKNDEPIFNDDLYAFKQGVVVENIRQSFQNDYDQFIFEAKTSSINIEESEEEVLQITMNLFSDVSAKELSDLTHEHKCWKDYYNKSKSEHSCWFNKENGIIPIDDIVFNYQDDLNLIKNILDSYEEYYEDTEEDCICIDDVKFYYNPKELKIDDSIKQELVKFPKEDNAYTMYIDESQGLIIY